MPIWLRKFTINEINTFYDEQNSQIKKQTQDKGSKTLISSDGTINTPEFLKHSKENKGKTSYK